VGTIPSPSLGHRLHRSSGLRSASLKRTSGTESRWGRTAFTVSSLQQPPVIRVDHGGAWQPPARTAHQRSPCGGRSMAEASAYGFPRFGTAPRCGLELFGCWLSGDLISNRVLQERQTYMRRRGTATTIGCRVRGKTGNTGRAQANSVHLP